MKTDSDAVPYLVGSLCLWVLISSLGGRGDPWPVVAAAALALTCHLAGRLLPTRVVPWMSLALAVSAVTAVSLGEGSLSDPLAGPLGYANANAAMVTHGAAAFAVAGWTGPAWLRLPAGVGVVTAILLCLEIRATAAAAGCALILVAMLASENPLTRRAANILSVSVLAAASVFAFVVGAGAMQESAAEVVSERRVLLWEDGVRVFVEQPLTGVGARDFAEGSPAAADEDTPEAHAELLQRAAENGLPGLLIEMSAVAAVAIMLFRRGTAASACSLAAWAALWANAGVDWVLNFPAVLSIGAFVSGLGAGPLHRAASSPSGPKTQNNSTSPI